MTYTRTWWCMLVAALLLAPAGFAAAREADAAYVLSRMHEINQLEIEAGRLAEERASSGEVRDYGERLWRDHRFNDTRVTELAGDLDVALVGPASLGPDFERRHQRLLKELEALRQIEGPAFDQRFMRLMADTHDAVIQDLSRLQDLVEAQPVRELVRKTIPILEQHRAVALGLLAERPWQEGES